MQHEFNMKVKIVSDGVGAETHIQASGEINKILKIHLLSEIMKSLQLDPADAFMAGLLLRKEDEDEDEEPPEGEF